MGIGRGAMEGLEMSDQFWVGRKVFLTGHTGFKGGWLALWLSKLGANVHGFALAPQQPNSMFGTCRIVDHLAGNTIADIRDASALRQAITSARPEIVLHLAAQPLVRASYTAPVETFDTNVMGLVNVLEAVRATPSVRAFVNVTTDKCYENREWVWPYREDEPLGGHDPYSASKACAEIVTSAYRRSFLASAGVNVATARAGNVIGGGDWAAERLIPDFLRAIDAGKDLTIRSPNATRPWQHVLEPLSGYLALARRLTEDEGAAVSEAWNFGPEEADAQTVEWIVRHLCERMPGASWRLDQGEQPHEANVLRLDSSKAKKALGWRPRWRISEALEQTLAWHRAWRDGADMADVSLRQIELYEGTEA
jgi:CDP-glucose 4,6-dehydratase